MQPAHASRSLSAKPAKFEPADVSFIYRVLLCQQKKSLGESRLRVFTSSEFLICLLSLGKGTQV